MVEFNAVDSESGRREYDSRQTLKKLIQDSLLGYNWRLMSEGVSYRMGFLSGRLKGIEKESDLVRFGSNKLKGNLNGT